MKKKILKLIISGSLCLGLILYFVLDCTSYRNHYCRAELERLYTEMQGEGEYIKSCTVPTALLKRDMCSLLLSNLSQSIEEIIERTTLADDAEKVSEHVSAVDISTDYIPAYEGRDKSLVLYASLDFRETIMNCIETKDDGPLSEFKSKFTEFVRSYLQELAFDFSLLIVWIFSVIDTVKKIREMKSND